MSHDLKSRRAAALKTLKGVGQEHVLAFFDELSDAERASLLAQIESHSWPALVPLIEKYVVGPGTLELPGSIEPAPYYPADPGDDAELRDLYAEARRAGDKLIHDGQVAAFTVAGGQGTRLGWDGPKGTFPATPIKGKSLFQVFAESIAKTRDKYGAIIPWYIMTSPINDAPTRAFFEEHDYFGLMRENVSFFAQGTVPSFSIEGKALLADRGTIAANPDGHGGSLRALDASGALADMAERGVTQISYFQIDNPLVKCIDPLFLGLHAMDAAEMSSKMVAKAGPRERVGNFVLADGRIAVIEYSDLPDALADQTDEDGEVLFNAGSIAIHAMSVDFVRSLNKGDSFALPWHRAVKKVPHVDLGSGQVVEPAQPNAVKLETFVFDALPLAKRSIILEVERREEFGPIKNAEGTDSALTSKQLQSDRAGRWLKSAGVSVPLKPDGTANAVIELSPLTAVSPDDLRHTDAVLPEAINPGARVVL